MRIETEAVEVSALSTQMGRCGLFSVDCFDESLSCETFMICNSSQLPELKLTAASVLIGNKCLTL